MSPFYRRVVWCEMRDDFTDQLWVERALRDARRRGDRVCELAVVRGVVATVERSALRFEHRGRIFDLDTLARRVACPFPVALVEPVRAELVWSKGRTLLWLADCLEPLVSPGLELDALAFVRRVVEGGADASELLRLEEALYERATPRLHDADERDGLTSVRPSPPVLVWIVLKFASPSASSDAVAAPFVLDLAAGLEEDQAIARKRYAKALLARLTQAPSPRAS